ncbi:class I SAM-dependent methyltransferase [Planctomycetota bacterium]
MISKCTLCSSVELETKFEELIDHEYGIQGRFSFKKCNNCGLLMLWPPPTLEDLKSHYPPDYHGYHISSRGLISFLYRIIYFFRFREYKKLAGANGRILDIGCADAPYFDLLKEKYPQLKLTGIEFKDEIAEKGRKKGRDLITGTIADIEETKSYDLVIMNNLIEHVVDPVEEMRKANAILRPGGYILLETPNTKCWDIAIVRKYWGSLHVPRHTYLFSPSSAELLAEKSGFKIVSTKYLLSTDNWALSVQNYLQSTKRFRCSIKNGRAWYYKYLLLAFIPFCMLQLMFKKTGAFVVTLQKTPRH